MSSFIAALPMYDWPEMRMEVDAQWAELRERLRAASIDAPDRLVRRNADMPPVPGGIRDAHGRVIAPDPAWLPPDGFDLSVLWRHPRLLFSQTCWGPLESSDLAGFVEVIAQPDYSEVAGGQGAFYSSALLMRADRGNGDPPRSASRVDPPHRGKGTPAGLLPIHLLRGSRLAFNATDSMSGFLALKRDLESMGEGLAIFAEMVETGSHRASALAVAEDRADVAALDCRSWSLFKRFHREADELNPVGWTSPRKGLPYICAAGLPGDLVARVRNTVAG